MARLRASSASFVVLRSSASMLRLAEGETAFSTLQAGQRLAKPGLSGLSSNSSEQTAQIRRGKAIPLTFYKECEPRGAALFEGVLCLGFETYRLAVLVDCEDGAK
jgi:hypothetical protein